MFGLLKSHLVPRKHVQPQWERGGWGGMAQSAAPLLSTALAAFCPQCAPSPSVMSDGRTVGLLSPTIDLSVYVPASVSNPAVLCFSILHSVFYFSFRMSLCCWLPGQESGMSLHLLTAVGLGAVFASRGMDWACPRMLAFPPVLLGGD